MVPRSRRQFLQASAAVGTLAVAGCLGTIGNSPPTPQRQVDPSMDPAPGTWPSSLYDPRNTATNPDASPPRASPTTEWSIPFDEPVSTVIVGPDHVFASSRDRTLAVRKDGTEQWAVDIGGGLHYVEGRLYMSAGALLALDAATGDEQWRAFNDADDERPGTVYEADGTVYVTGEQAFHALHPDTGERLWQVEADRYPRVVADDRRVGLVDGDQIRFFEPGEHTDRLLRGPKPAAIEQTDVSWGRDVITPVLLEDTLFVPEFGDRLADVRGSVRRYDLGLTDERWMTPFIWSGVSAVAVDDEHVYATPYRATTDPPDGSVVALDRQTGAESWRFDGTFLGNPVVGGGTVIAGGSDPGSPSVCVTAASESETRTGTTENRAETGTCTEGEPRAASGVMHAFDATSGERLWSIKPGGTYGGYPIALADGRIYFGNADGLHALG